MKKPIDSILIIPRLQIQNLNAISSPLTWGFPGMTAILGFVHALERKLFDSMHIHFEGAGVICHRFIPHAIDSQEGKNFCLARNPLTMHGEHSSLNYEGRAHAELSLVINVQGSDCVVASDPEYEKNIEKIFAIVETLRIAGGSIMPFIGEKKRIPKLIGWPNNREDQLKESKRILKSLLPGFALICRKDLLESSTKLLQEKDPKATPLDALLDLSSRNFEAFQQDEGEEHSIFWEERKKTGWIVPITVGYQAITKLFSAGKVANARDKKVPFQFVENIYSIGQWISPHRLINIEEIIWEYSVDLNKGLYCCVNKNSFN